MSSAQALLERLLAVEFPGRADLKRQAATARITEVTEGGAPAFLLAVDESLRTRAVQVRIPVEAEAPDLDGILVHILLHVVDGKMTEIEVYREDGEPVTALPAPEALLVTVNTE